MDTIREFAVRFGRDESVGGVREAYELLEEIAKLASPLMNDIEKRAFLATVKYLEAKEMEGKEK